ncbi:MAG: hypothetical protein A3H71_03685 [Candidatus Sungbacteria bacterium RIFCSPLOWO2_02_FULL_48_13b]|uniref:Sphingomyelin synthase-like domain-containing protein n=1 Tax=Candidatus Sungbacteria bacterium RIFCSPLOWO2_02_FULL_48_13b TaxID=1802283 RepID=A0A1G2LDI6_9BACT|nr:MAG: hypothetical protein A3H71_03685 [Candidatus Sungbacteria bacterium RIFCSPLOWO2_02_FULL_48_13b]
MNSLKNKYKLHFGHSGFLASFAFSILLLALALVVNFYAGVYATEKASNSVTDIVLSNIRVYDVDGIFVYGSIILWIFVSLLLLLNPGKIPFTVKSIALFVLIRSVFISLTHIGPFPTQIAIDSNLLNKFSFAGDLFFSAHVGLPFLLALVFWDDLRLRILFIVSAIIFAAVVLLAHLHYSIDVLAAFFITFTIYRIAEMIFAKDRKLFFAGIQE